MEIIFPVGFRVAKLVLNWFDSCGCRFMKLSHIHIPNTHHVSVELFLDLVGEAENSEIVEEFFLVHELVLIKIMPHIVESLECLIEFSLYLDLCLFIV